MRGFEIVTDEGRNRISYNGILDTHSYTHSEIPLSGTLYDTEIIKELLKTPLSELENEVTDLLLKSEDISIDLPGYDRLELILSGYLKHSYELVITLNYDFSHWAKPYSLYDYWNAIVDDIKAANYRDISTRNADGGEDDSYLNGLDVVIKMSHTNWTMQSYLDEYIPIIEKIISRVINKLTQPKSGFNVEFDFPEEIKAPCEQYLMYFSQFMMDLGVKVNNEISHEGDKTILSVVPENRDEALSNIRDALTAYVSLPQENITPTFEPTKDIAIAQLEFNVTNLKSQLQLVQSTMIAYEHTIKAQKIALDAFQIKEQSNTLLASKEPEKKDDIEPVFGNLFQVKKYDKNGIVIDYPELVRALKRKFS